jgi:ribosome modulation factor
MNDVKDPPLLGLSVEDFMVAYQDGELAGLEGKSFLACPYFDDNKRLRVWMLGYLEQPIQHGSNGGEGENPLKHHPIG